MIYGSAKYRRLIHSVSPLAMSMMTVNNLTEIHRPDGTIETKTFDSMYRVTSDTVPKTGMPNNVTEWVTTNFEYYPDNATQMAGQLLYLIDGKQQIGRAHV